MLRAKREIFRDNIPLIAAGVAFYSLLAIAPAFATSIALWGLFTDPQTLEAQIAQLTTLLPTQAAETFRDQLHNVAAKSSTALGWTAVTGFVIALWSARAATNAMIRALNIVYEEDESRGFFKLALLSLALTLGALVGGVLALLLVAGIPAVLALVGIEAGTELLVQIARWVVLLGLVMFGLAVLYRFAPSRRKPRWRWVSWGAAIATLLWVGASVGFSLFVANFGKYGETYGALAGVVVLLMWLWISAFAALVGAELDAEMEHQTARDTTVGREKPMGKRNAWVADHVAQSPGKG